MQENPKNEKKSPKDLLPVQSKAKAAIAYMARKKNQENERKKLGSVGPEDAMKKQADVAVDALESKGSRPEGKMSEKEMRREMEISARKSSVGLESKTGASSYKPERLSREDAIKQGYFVEKGIDLFPTEKYNKAKREGRLESIGL